MKSIGIPQPLDFDPPFIFLPPCCLILDELLAMFGNTGGNLLPFLFSSVYGRWSISLGKKGSKLILV